METLDLDLLRTLAAIASHDSFAAAAVQMGRTQSAITQQMQRLDRKSTRLNSSHLVISYAVFCLKKKNPAVTDTLARCQSRTRRPPMPPTPSALQTARSRPCSRTTRGAGSPYSVTVQPPASAAPL